MTTHDQSEAIFSLFLGKLAAPEAEALRAHVRGCAACRRVYERMAAAEGALGGGALSPLAQSRVQQRLLGAAPVSAQQPWWVVAAVAATATLGIAIFPRPPPEMAPRGGSGQLSAGTSLRVLRIRNYADGPQVADASSGQVGLAPGDTLRLLYTNLDGAPLARVVIYLDQQPLHSMEYPLALGGEDKPLGAPLPVTEAWLSGRLEVVAVFGRAPLPELRWDSPASDAEHRVRRVRLSREAP